MYFEVLEILLKFAVSFYSVICNFRVLSEDRDLPGHGSLTTTVIPHLPTTLRDAIKCNA